MEIKDELSKNEDKLGKAKKWQQKRIYQKNKRN